MRTTKLTGDEVKVLYDTLNQGDPQRGLSISEVRELMPIIDRLEAPATKRQITTPQGRQEIIEFKATTLVLKESEFTICLNKLDSTAGILSVEYGRKVVNLHDKLKEIPTVADPEEKSDKKD